MTSRARQTGVLYAPGTDAPPDRHIQKHFRGMKAEMIRSWSTRDARLSMAIAVLVLAGLIVLFADPAFPQTNPFVRPRPPAAPPETGLVGWLLAKQSEFYRQLSSLVRAAKADGSAVWTLLGVSFLYGIFHAAGPGHGKAVISSYLVANEETWRRGVVLSFASALLQAVVAIAVVGIAAALLQATARTMNMAVRGIEIASYALIALIGLRLTWTKGRGFLAALRDSRLAPLESNGSSNAPDPVPRTLHAAAAVSATSESCACGHHDHAHDHGQPDAHRHEHPHGDHCGHSHGPAPQELAGPGGWKRGVAAIFAVGLRPCSGAILVLVFALAQGLFWAGVASTFVMGVGTAVTVAAIATLAVGARGIAARFASSRSGTGTLALRGIEAGAALLVLLFGVALLSGYMVTERLLGV